MSVFEPICAPILPRTAPSAGNAPACARGALQRVSERLRATAGTCQNLTSRAQAIHGTRTMPCTSGADVV